MPRAAIIGAGPAGSVAAILLARAGWSVTVIEQHTFPRDKVCGECVSDLGIDVLRQLGLMGSFAALGSIELKRTHFHAPNGSSMELPLRRSMLGISRMRFDQFLLDEAAAIGALISIPVRCEAIRAGVLTVRDLRSNRCDTHEADWILLADGKGALLPRRSQPTGDFGVKAHFEGVDGPRDAIELFGVRGSYGGLAPIEDGRWNWAFSIPKQMILDHEADLDRISGQLLAENRSLLRRMRNARRCSGWLAAPLPRFGVTNDWPAGIIPLGNAAAAIEPIGGEGIGLAMHSAALAAQALIESHEGHGEPDLHLLRAQLRSLYRPRGWACRIAALAASSRLLADFAVPVLDGHESPLGVLMRLAGKSG
jgi:flavin-dependent dehydrogenase